MKTGSIVEQGSHEELLEAGGQYAEYYNALTSSDPGEMSNANRLNI